MGGLQGQRANMKEGMGNESDGDAWDAWCPRKWNSSAQQYIVLCLAEHVYWTLDRKTGQCGSIVGFLWGHAYMLEITEGEFSLYSHRAERELAF